MGKDSTTPFEELFPTFNEGKTEDVTSIEMEIEHLKGLQNFATTPVGKQLVEERERQLFAVMNKLILQLREPNNNQIISYIIQLKFIIRDLIDFKGCTNSIEAKQAILDSILKKKTE